MSTLFDRDPEGFDSDGDREHTGSPSVSAELEHAVRARGVRVEERLALLAELGEAGGEAAIDARIDQLERRIREASRKVAATLRGSGR